MATFELYRRSTVGMCLTETLDQMVSGGVLSPELAIQVLIQFDKSMTEALENEVKTKVSIKAKKNILREVARSCIYRDAFVAHVGIFTPTDSVTMFGLSSYKRLRSKVRKARKRLSLLR